MSYFTTRKIFLTPSFDLNVKEEEKILRFLHLLEEANVASIINKCVKNNTSKGGRPGVNYYNLFATILFGFAFGRDTLRDLEDACEYDLRYIYLMEQTKVDHSTICTFINKVIVPYEKEIFALINIQIKKELNIEFEDAFIDGSKFEANANKYKFVWKPTTYHKKISITFFDILKKNSICTSYHFEEQVSSKTVSSSISELCLLKDKLDSSSYNHVLKALTSILSKVIEYEEKERICGPNRNSYYKTDHDATAMALKADYYARLGTHMHAAYNTQILVVKGIVFSYYVSQSRSDIADFIPILKEFHKLYNCFPKNVCADAGYGSLENYEFMNNNGIGNYVKYFSWEGNSSGKNPDCYHLNKDNTITCLNGHIGNQEIIEGRHPRKSKAVFYKINGCTDCSFKLYCMRFNKNTDVDFKIFEVVPDLIKYKQQAEENLLSKKGIEIRVNRSIQVEGVFGNEKQNRNYTRIRRRGLNKASTEAMLVLLGLNIRKLFKYYETKTLPKFWIAPEDLQPQTFKKASAKKLSKKGKRLNEKQYANKQA
ncbi:MAG: transposase [Bacilli bacterium]